MDIKFNLKLDKTEVDKYLNDIQKNGLNVNINNFRTVDSQFKKMISNINKMKQIETLKIFDGVQLNELKQTVKLLKEVNQLNKGIKINFINKNNTSFSNLKESLNSQEKQIRSFAKKIGLTYNEELKNTIASALKGDDILEKIAKEKMERINKVRGKQMKKDLIAPYQDLRNYLKNEIGSIYVNPKDFDKEQLSDLKKGLRGTLKVNTKDKDETSLDTLQNQMRDSHKFILPAEALESWQDFGFYLSGVVSKYKELKNSNFSQNSLDIDEEAEIYKNSNKEINKLLQNLKNVESIKNNIKSLDNYELENKGNNNKEIEKGNNLINKKNDLIEEENNLINKKYNLIKAPISKKFKYDKKSQFKLDKEANTYSILAGSNKLIAKERILSNEAGKVLKFKKKINEETHKIETSTKRVQINYDKQRKKALKAQKELLRIQEKKALKEKKELLRIQQKIKSFQKLNNNVLNDLSFKYKGFYNNKEVDSFRKQLSKLSPTSKTLEKDINRLQNKIKQFKNELGSRKSDYKLGIDVSKLNTNGLNINSNEQNIDSFIKKVHGVNAEIQKISSVPIIENGKQIQKVNYKVKEGKDKWHEYQLSMVQAVDGGKTSLKQLDKGLKDVSNRQLQWKQRLAHAWRSVVAFAGVSGLFFGIKRVIQNGIESIIELDTAMINLKKVTNETDETYNNFIKTANQMAISVGHSTKSAIDATTEFSKLGYTFNQSQELAKNSLIYSNIGDVDISDATKSITSNLKGFNMTAQDTTHMIDAMNEVGNNFSVTSGGIGDALQKSSASLNQARNSFEESIGLVVAGNASIQNTEEVGTALKTISMRLRGIKEDSGETIPKLKESIEMASGVNIMKDGDTFKSTYEILLEISKVYDTLSDKNKAYLQELIAGKRQGNVFASIMQNMKEGSSATKTAMNSAGSAMREQEKYMSSVTAKINTFKESVIMFWNNFMNTDTLKEFIDIGTSLIHLLDKLFNGFDHLRLGVALLFTGILGSFKFYREWMNKVVTVKEKTGELTVNLFEQKRTLKSLGTSFETATNKSGLFIGSLKFLKNGLKAVKLSAIGTKIAVKGLQIAMTMGISVIITKGLELIDSVMSKSENAKENIKELNDDFRSSSEENTKNIKNLNNMSDEYENLSNKTNLTFKEQERLNGLNNEIAGMFPNLVTGYDEQGNAILNLTKNLSEYTDKLKEKQEVEALDYLQKGKDDGSFKDTFKKAKDYQKELKNFNTQIKNNKEGYYNKKIKIPGASSFVDGIRQLKEELAQVPEGSDKAKQIKRNIDSLNKSNKKLSQQVKLTSGKFEEQNNKLTLYKQNLLLTNEDFKKLNDDTKNFLSKYISNLSVTDFESLKELEEHTNNLIEIVSKNPKSGGVILEIEKLNKEAKTGKIKDYEGKITKLLKQLSKLTGLDPSVLSKLFKIEVNELKQGNNELKKTVKTIEEVNKEYSNSVSSMQFYHNAIKELNEDGKLSGSTINEIIEKHDELIPYLLGNTSSLYSKMQQLENDEKNNAIKAIYAKLEMNKEFFKNIMDSSPKLVNTLKEAYGDDFNNFKTIVDAKGEINKLLIESIGNNWSDLYSTEEEALQGIVNSYGKLPLFLNEENNPLNYKPMITNKDTENYNKAKAQLALIERLKKAREEAKNKLKDFNLELDKNTKGTEKARYEVNAYANAIKALKTAQDELNSSMNKLHKNSDEYSNALDKKIALKKKEIALTEKEINRNNQLATTYKNMPVNTSNSVSYSNEGSNTNLDTVLKGRLKGYGQTFINSGKKYGVDPALIASITMAETGGDSYALNNQNNPAGIMDWNNNWKTVKMFNSLTEGIDFAVKNLKDVYISKGLTTISQIGSKYAPIGASNDPNGLNKNWIPTVTRFYQRMTGGKGGSALIGSGQFSGNDKDPIEEADKAWNKVQDLKQKIINLKDEISKIHFEKYQVEVGKLDEKIQLADLNAEIYKERANKWSNSLVNNFKNFDKYIDEIQNKNNILLQKQQYIKNQIQKYGKNYNKDNDFEMRKELQNTLKEIEAMTKALQEVFSQKWTFKFDLDGRIFKEFETNIDVVQDKIDLLNEKDLLYSQQKSKLLKDKTQEQEKYLINIQKEKIDLIAGRDVLKENSWEWTFLNDKIKEYDDKIRETLKTLKSMNEELKNTLNNNLTNLKNIEQKIIAIIKKRYETELEDFKKLNKKQLDAEEKRHKDKINNLDKEKKAQEEIVNQQLKNIDKNEGKNSYEKQLNNLIKEKSKLQYQYNSWMLVNTLEGKNKRESIQEGINKKQEEIDELTHKRNIDLRKQNLNDKLDTIKKSYDKEKKTEDEKYDNTKKKLNKQLKDKQEYYKKLQRKDNLYSEAKKALFRNQIKYIDGKVMDLSDAILKYEDEWGEGLSILGSKIKSDLIMNLENAIDTVKNLDSILKKIQDIEYPNMKEKDVVNHTGGIVYAQSDDNTKLNDYISAKNHLEDLGFKIVDITEMTKEELKKIKLSTKDLVIGNALNGYSLNGAKRIQGSNRFDTDSQIGDYAYKEKRTYKNNDESPRIVYTNSDKNKDVNDWLSAKRRFEELGFKIVDVSKMDKSEQESMNVTKNDVVLGQALIDRTDISKGNRLQGKDRFETDELIEKFIKYEEDRRVGLSNDNKNVVYAQSDSNKKINDYLIAERWLSSLGYKIVDITKLTKEQLEKIKITKGDLVIGNALKNKYIPSTQRITGDRREETNEMVEDFAKHKDKELHGDIKDIRNIVYGWGKDLQNAQKWLSVMGYKFVNSKNLSPDELATMLRKGDIVLGETGVSPISNRILQKIGAIRLGGNSSKETLQKIIAWLKEGGVPAYSEGGINTTTGLAMLHGTSNNPEMVLNANQSRNLYDIIKNPDSFFNKNNLLPNLGTRLSNILRKHNTDSTIIQLDSLIKVMGNLDKSVVDKTKRNGRDTLESLRRALNSKGVFN